ncbi:MAG: DUF6036 family nucleotidyltransferase [Promethearchaeota archaeon]
MENKLTQTIFSEATHLKIPAIILGGLALPAYNVARTTLDIDICVYIESQEKLNLFIKKLKQNGISTVQDPKIEHDLFTVFGKNNEAKIWLRPCDAFSWDQQMVEKIRLFSENIFVLAIEDYILTKLARLDRSSTDLSDILQLLIANKDKIDWEYLRFRLKWKDLTNDFKEILKSFEFKPNNNLYNISKEILDKFQD